MSDHSRTQLLIQDAYLAQLAASAPRSTGFAQLFALNSSASVAGENWHALFISPQDARSSYGPPFGTATNFAVRELEAKMIASSLEADALASTMDCSQLEKLSHLHSSHLRQLGSSQVFNDVWPDCRPLWMHNSALLARQEVEANKADSATTSGRASMPDQSPEMELSRRLIGASEASCLASTVPECQIKPAILQHVSTGPPQSLPAASEWSVSMNEANMRGRFMEPDRISEILQYPFDPEFVERAGKFSSFSTENYPGFSEYVPDDQRGIRCADAPVEGQCIPKKSVKSLYGLCSDTRAIKLVSASPSLAVTAAKIEIPPNDCIPAGGDFLGADKRLSISGPQLCSPHSVGGKRRGSSQQFEQKTIPLGEAATSSSPHAQPVAGDDAETQDPLRLKRGRVAQNEENLALLHRKEVKDGDQVPINVSLKRDQNNEPDSKMKEEPKTENGVKGKNDKSMGQLSSKTGKNRMKKVVADQSPKLDVIHVRARRGQATDSHSLAERVRREKIGERMRLLQDLVPGCNKATGKAMMLDEIINYVQSLQHQVEFLAMKLAALNPRLDINLDSFIDGDIAVMNKALDSEMATSAGVNLNLRKQDTSVAHVRSDSEANYGLLANITRDDMFAADKDLNGMNRSGFSNVI